MAANARDALVKLIRNLPAAYRYPTDPSHVREVAGHSAGRRRWRRGFRLAPQAPIFGPKVPIMCATFSSITFNVVTTLVIRWPVMS